MAESSGAWDTSQEDDAGGAVVNDSIEKLFYAWRTEVNAPDILPFKQELVDEMQELLKNQETYIEERFENATESDYFTVTLYQMDIERVKYSLSRYLRTRLLKIETSLEFLESNIEMRDRLSFPEKIFHGKLKNLNNAHFDEAVFGKLPEKVKENVLETDRDRLAHAHPNMEEFVFCKVMQDCNNVELAPGNATNIEPINLLKGDTPSHGRFICTLPSEIHVLPYGAVQEYVLDESLQLL